MNLLQGLYMKGLLVSDLSNIDTIIIINLLQDLYMKGL